MTEITVTVSGPVGCGKSAIAGEIEIAMRAIGVPVRFADEAGWQSEKNMTHADWQDYLEMYQPSVVIGERNWPAIKVEAAVGGAYEMQDGRRFWVDAPVAREIVRRVMNAIASTGGE